MMMRGRFYDGRSSRPHTVEARIDGLDLVFEANGDEHQWPLARLDVDIHDGEARLSCLNDRDARLILAEADWLAADGGVLQSSRGRRRRAERRLLILLIGSAASVAAFVFIGMPILSGPLARNTPVDYERSMGQNFDLQVAHIFPDCTGLTGQAALHRLGKRIGAHADTEFEITVRAVHAPMANAFALPGGPVLLTDDLIRQAESSDEIAAIIAHEVAHVEKRHVMQAVWRSLGIGLVLDAVVGGGAGAGQQAVLLAGQVTDLRYSRAAESEADQRGVELLHAAGLSSEGMASVFERFGQEERPRGWLQRQASEFMATHPDTARRATSLQAMQRPGAQGLADEDWAVVRQMCESVADEAVRRRLLGVPVDFNNPAPDQSDQVGQD